MIQLWQGLHDYFANNVATAALRALLSGGLHNLLAPENVSYPYAVFQVVDITPDNFASAKNFVENCLIQFNLFSDASSMVSLLNIYDKFVESFDFCDALVVASHTVLSCVREGTIQAEQIKGIWQLNITYRVKLRP